jgi:L-fuculose-phosphate aldolase
MPQLFEIRRQIVDVCQRMYTKGWVAANDGNISVRLDADRIIATPTLVSKGMVTEDDLVICDMDGTKISGRTRPSSELAMHLMCYRERTDATGCVHAHPPYSTGYAVAGLPLDQCTLPEVVIAIGTVPLAEYGLPSTDELCEKIRPHIHESDAVLMANHGVVAVGRDLIEAYFRMETVEHLAKIDFVARHLGGARRFTEDEAKELLALRGNFGLENPNVGCVWDTESENSDEGQNGASQYTEMELVEEITKRVVEALAGRS